jgi:hypothetical protein
MNIKDVLGLLGHKTEVAGLHPFQQAAFEEARSTLLSLGDDPLTTIGCDSPWDVAKYLFAGFDRTGQKANDMPECPGIPAYRFLGDKAEPGQKPSPVMFTVPSTVSRRCATVYFMFTAITDMGYGEISTAVALVDDICDDWDEAQARVEAMGKALNTVLTVAKMEDRRKDKFGIDGPTDGPAF